MTTRRKIAAVIGTGIFCFGIFLMVQALRHPQEGAGIAIEVAYGTIGVGGYFVLDDVILPQ